MQLYREHITPATVPDGDRPDGPVFAKMLVCNKMDLLTKSSPPPPPSSEEEAVLSSHHPVLQTLQTATGLMPFTTSCVRGEGLTALETGIKQEIDRLLQRSASSSSSAAESVLITRERHRGHVKRCIGHLNHFLSGYLPMDAAAEELRLAMMEMGKVTGRVDVEELLDIIFRDFCIGK